MSDTSIPELAIVNEEGASIFARGDRYEIPLYQRPYAWDERNIEQLLEDVRDISDDGEQKYYLGSLVVYPKDKRLYEVIDGQQRLTTLYLLLAALGMELGGEGEPALSFSCREKSGYTLKHMRELVRGGDVEYDRTDQGIVDGLEVIQQWLKLHAEERDALVGKLARTCLYRIEVPKGTDLNHYFEIMNTRGEQLEQHEVLKARLMEPLSGTDSARFARIWDACSDMGCYVQMRFGVEKRQKLFCWGYDQFPTSGRIRSVDWERSDSEQALGIKDIVKSVSDGRGTVEDPEPSRFESIIDFRYFLLHALKVFVHVKGIVDKNGEQSFVPRQLDDKRLAATFGKVLAEGLWDGERIDPERFSNEFAECLLQVRFLFDRCIIKREYDDSSADGVWSLKELQRGNKKSVYYRNTRFKRRYRERGTTSDGTNKTVLMLESCLRVSFTSPKVMHWITELLCALMDDLGLAGSERFVGVVEAQARGQVREFVAAGDYAKGVETPHIVLNYLDYLLWRRDRDRLRDRGSDRDRPRDFSFEFRTSVEHWYPQNPSDDTFKRWDEVDRLGNLCLVQRNINSKFSNLNPLAKKATFQEMIAGGSLKLRKMSDLTNGGDDWREGACQRHEEEMLALLREACGVAS